jgi:type II secretory pathway component PulC
VTAVYAGHDVRGVRVQNVGPDSFWHMVGVRSGDVVTDYNGVRIDTPTAMLALLNSMEGDSVIRLRVRGTDEDKRTLYYSAPR